MNLKNKDIMEGMRVTNGKDKLKVISWDKSCSDCLLKYLDSKGNRYVVAQSYKLSGTEKDPQISWANGRYFTANSDDEAFKEYLDYLGEVNEYDISESLKEEIDRLTWSKWVVNNIHHIEYFFNGKIVDKKMLNSLFESEGFDTDVDTVEDEIKKAVRSVRLGNLDGNALHIAHNFVGNRIDLVFDIGGLLGDVESLSNDECMIRINGDIYEQDEMWNFGFAIYLTCHVYPLDFSLAESKKKSLRKSLKERDDAIFAKDVKHWMLSGNDINITFKDGNELVGAIYEHRKDSEDKKAECFLCEDLTSDYTGDYFIVEIYNGKISEIKFQSYDWLEDYIDKSYELKESKKSVRKNLKESLKPINEKNVAKFVDELNKFCDEKIHYVDADAERFTKKYGKMYNFKYYFDDTDEIFVVYDSEGTLDMFDDASYVREEIDRLAKKNGWYADPYTSSANFTFGEL